MADEAKSRLGRGLAALIGDVAMSPPRWSARAASARADRFVKPNPRNRAAILPMSNSTNSRHRSANAASSSRSWLRTTRGAIDQYEIIAGERRWRVPSAPVCMMCRSCCSEVSDRER